MMQASPALGVLPAPGRARVLGACAGFTSLASGGGLPGPPAARPSLGHRGWW